MVWSLSAVAGLVWTAVDQDAWAELDRHGDPVSGSDSCRSCHPEQWRTWHDSWHRTMTQRASEDGALAVSREAEPRAFSRQPSRPEQAGVLAPFAGETLDYGGFRATMSRGPQGAPRVLVEGLDVDTGQVEGRAILDVEVALTVGSHRYQQYVAYLDRGGGPAELWRLPVAWHREEARWIHMNGAFVEPEGELGSIPDYERHLSRWNDNCIFCHNTQGAPGVEEGGEFASRVGELGIACEACHGPASAHIERHRGNPLRRLLASGRDRADGSIANPNDLGPQRSSEICGRCHGQRIAKNIDQVMHGGDGFVAGDPLASVSRPIFADSTLAGVEGLAEGQPFATRFWPDQSPRLSAYEYQGLLLSACWDEGEGLGCEHCHDMHADSVDGQLREGREGAASCVSCHAPQELSARPGALHGGHDEEAVDCLDCHMPRTSYGLLEGMISHRITSPDPGAWIGRDDQPDACTQCHVDRSRSWAARSMPALGFERAVLGVPHPDEALASRVALDLLGGDAIQRNLAADALANPKASGSIEVRMGWIAEGLEDEYPSVRWFAWRGLRALARLSPEDSPGRGELLDALANFDYLGPIDERVEALSRVRALVGPGLLVDHPQVRERLFARRHASAIWIGE